MKKIPTTNGAMQAMGQFRALFVLATISVAGAAMAQDIRATVDSTPVRFPDVQPRMYDGRVMVPVRGVFEHMNAHVSWDPSTRTVTAHRGTDTIKLTLNSFTAMLNGRQVNLDSPPRMYQGRTLVPLRFLSESLGASVEWIAASRLVEINTVSVNTDPNPVGYKMMRMDAGSVLPFVLDQQLGSSLSRVGDRFTAKWDPDNSQNHGLVLEGHVAAARARDGNTPGVLGLAFDRVRLPSGVTYPVDGSLIGLDSNTVETRSGQLVVRSGIPIQDIKFVGFGKDAILVPIRMSNSVLTNVLINESLGTRYQEITLVPTKSQNVVLSPGTRIGVRLSNNLSLRVPNGS